MGGNASPPISHVTRIFVIALALMIIAGPFGTYVDLDLPFRAAYWTVALIGCGVIFHYGIKWTISAKLRRDWSRFSRLCFGVALASIPCSAFIYVLEHTFREGMSNETAVWLIPCVAAVGLFMGYVNFMPPFFKVVDPKPEMEPPVPEVPAPEQLNGLPTIPFLERLPGELGTELISLSMHDHYVEVTTEKGSTMLHMRFSDAMSELSDYPGKQIHRSHWISEAAAVKLSKSGRQWLIETSDGRMIPVSKTYLADIKEMLVVNDRSAT